ncbi:MAG TPA: hypothetical protein VLW46_00095 [Candidatus Bathyarchaeia archaeon]|nr:hypothetical protein [Candidatus Bathyarchaeia archaeon]
MTTPSPQQPHRASERTRYNPITFDQVNQASGSVLTRPIGTFFSGRLAEPVDELAGPVARSFALPLFAFIFFFTQRMPLVSPLLIVVLLGCLISRMEGRVRQVAAVPLSLAAVKLAFAMMSYCTEEQLINHRLQTGGFQPGLYWLPIFFSACLAFIRDKDTATFKLVFVCSCILLASGLLPSIAFIGIFYVLDVLLFFGIVIAIFIDTSAYFHKQPEHSSAAAQ